MHPFAVTVAVFVGLIVLLHPMYASSVRAASPHLDMLDSEDWVRSSGPSLGYIVIVNLPEKILRLYETDGTSVINDFLQPIGEYPVGIGTKTFPTPEFNSVIGARSRRPAWNVPESSWAGELAGSVVAFDSEINPFRVQVDHNEFDGFFVALEQKGIGFHTTNNSFSVGRISSHGCMRMSIEDIVEIYRLPIGTTVETRYDLFRIEKTDETIEITMLPDVYDRYSKTLQQRQLARHLKRHGLSDPGFSAQERRIIGDGGTIRVDVARFDQNPMKVRFPKP